MVWVLLKGDGIDGVVDAIVRTLLGTLLGAPDDGALAHIEVVRATVAVVVPEQRHIKNLEFHKVKNLIYCHQKCLSDSPTLRPTNDLIPRSIIA